MTLQDFDAYASERGYRLVASTMYGVSDGYPFGTIIRFVNKKTVTLTTGIVTTGVVEKSLLKEIKRLLPKGSQVVVKNKNGISFLLSAKQDALLTSYEEGMRAITGKLREYGLYPVENCAICGALGCDGYMDYQGDYRMIHITCGERVCESMHGALKDNIQNGSYGKAALFALVGALVGAIPTVLLLIIGRYIAALLCALIPIASSWAYGKANGKRTGTGTLIICFCSLVAGLAVCVACTYSDFVTYLGLWPSVTSVIQYMVMEPAEYGRIGQILLFVGLGVVFSYSYISKTAYSMGNNVEMMRDTITEKN